MADIIHVYSYNLNLSALLKRLAGSVWKGLLTKPEDLSLVPGTYMEEGGH